LVLLKVPLVSSDRLPIVPQGKPVLNPNLASRH
jgi:hypothetical protein